MEGARGEELRSEATRTREIRSRYVVMHSHSHLTLGRGLWGTSTGHVLTRIVQKGADAFGTLKEYDGELDVLEALLNQRRWRRGRRGKWYDRRAPLFTRYLYQRPRTLWRAAPGLLHSL